MPPSRQLVLTHTPFHGKSVVYVMSRDQRSQDNHALLAAQETALTYGVPLYVVFILKKVGVRSREHYQFMLEGLMGLQEELASYGIPLVLRAGNPVPTILDAIKDSDAGAIFFDFSPLQGARSIVKKVAAASDCSVSVVDTHNIIPAWVVSDKKEFAAHTMRHKVHKQLEQYLVSPAPLQKQTIPAPTIKSLSFDEARAIIETIPASGLRVQTTPGEAAGLAHLKEFISTIATYANGRNNIAVDYQSGLSPYLHFGQISSLRVALDVIDAVNHQPLLLRQVKLAEHSDQPSAEDGMNALLEEMIVRKELADNFCFYGNDYLSLAAAPDWAQKSLSEHQDDIREFSYTPQQWEQAQTHDEVWNAAQLELTKTGKMHGYMRMYWAKKILEWSPDANEAISTAIYLNDKYSIDGGDPNGYVGILWSIAGLHDRPWFERPVFGKVRYMNSAGLYRKFDVDAYIKRVNEL